MPSLEEYFQTAIKAKDTAGAIVLASDSTGKFRYAKAMGNRTLINGDQKSLGLNDIVFIASCTKLFTTIAAIQCIERGQLKLHDDIAKVIPELADKDVLTGFDEATNQPQLQKASAPITLALLLTHQSGIVYDLMDPKLQRYRAWLGDKAPKGTTVPERNDYPLGFHPGASWMYGSSVDWAGMAVERVTGQTLDEYFKTHILSPLGIAPTETTFWPMAAGLQDRMVDYSKDDPEGLGLPVGMGVDVHQGATACFGGHGLYSTGPAYLKVLESLLRNDGQLVSKQMGEEMFKPQLGLGGKKGLNDIVSSDPGYSYFGQSGRKGAERDWGFGGLLLMENQDGFMGKQTLEWGGGINLTWFIDRETGLCGFGDPTIVVGADAGKVIEMKETFKRGVYEKYKAWKAGT